MGGNGETMERLAPFLQRSSPRVLIFKEIGNGDRVLGFSMFHWARLSMLYNEFNNNMVSEYIRDNAVGRIVVLDGIFTDKENSHENLEQIILTETLCTALQRTTTMPCTGISWRIIPTIRRKRCSNSRDFKGCISEIPAGPYS